MSSLAATAVYFLIIAAVVTFVGLASCGFTRTRRDPKPEPDTAPLTEDDEAALDRIRCYVIAEAERRLQP